MEIPLFPLPNLVLFPNVVVPLHIFEERYKMMISGCIDKGEPFGLVLLRAGTEEETKETIHRVGVTATIVQVERLEQGRMNILCQGESRFRIRRFTEQHPFWKGFVELFEDDEKSLSDASLYDRIAGLYRQVFDLGIKLSASEPTEPALPENATDLSFMLSYVLDIDSEEKQALLEMTSTSERLQVLVTHLDDTIRKLEQQIAYKAVVAKVRGNGDLGKPRAE